MERRKKFLCFFHFISLREHDFSIFTRKLAEFHHFLPRFCPKNASLLIAHFKKSALNFTLARMGWDLVSGYRFLVAVLWFS
jgi:hypothetical protein